MSRVVGLVDMNSFFASCHQAEQPELEGRAVIVTGDPARRAGIVLAASYPAKEKGVKAGMPIREAKRLCPEAHFFVTDYPLYVDYSARILKIARDFTDQIEPFSIDEFFIEITNIVNLWGAKRDIAQKLKERIRAEAGVFCSVGVGPNKLIAKMAAGLQKPNGLTIIENLDEYRRTFYHKPVRELFGIGPRYERHLKYLNVHTIGDLARYPVAVLKQRWGKNGELLWYCARGIDSSPVLPSTLDTCKSIGQQRTLPRDIRGFEKIKVIILELTEMVARRVRQGGYAGRTVYLTLRDTQLNFLSRSMSMPDYSDLPDDIYAAACRLLAMHWNEAWPVRLVGLTLGNLVQKKYEQFDLFGKKEHQSKIARACDTIRDRFGEKAIFRGVSLTEDSLNVWKPQ